MVTVIVAIHVVVCLSLVIIILIQHGKGADVGAVFGGSSQTVFGASGAGNALTRATSALAVVFFATSIFLAYASTQRMTGSIFNRPFGGSSVMPIKPKNLVPPIEPAAPPANAASPATR
jgi:preprotein translocase subunit SecG